MSVEKIALRREMVRVLSSLDPRWVRSASKELSLGLSRLLDEREELSTIKHVLAWASHFSGEVELDVFINKALEQGRSVYLPQSNDDATMEFYQIDFGWRDALSPGLFGIPEPVADETRRYQGEPRDTVAVIVPGIAFDRGGDRLGRGRGFYDRALAGPTLRGAVKIGVCWSLQILDVVPTAGHDILVDWIVHERGVLDVASRRTSGSFRAPGRSEGET